MNKHAVLLIAVVALAVSVQAAPEVTLDSPNDGASAENPVNFTFTPTCYDAGCGAAQLFFKGSEAGTTFLEDFSQSWAVEGRSVVQEDEPGWNTDTSQGGSSSFVSDSSYFDQNANRYLELTAKDDEQVTEYADHSFFNYDAGTTAVFRVGVNATGGSLQVRMGDDPYLAGFIIEDGNLTDLQGNQVTDSVATDTTYDVSMERVNASWINYTLENVDTSTQVASDEFSNQDLDQMSTISSINFTLQEIPTASNENFIEAKADYIRHISDSTSNPTQIIEDEFEDLGLSLGWSQGNNDIVFDQSSRASDFNSNGFGVRAFRPFGQVLTPLSEIELSHIASGTFYTDDQGDNNIQNMSVEGYMPSGVSATDSSMPGGALMLENETGDRVAGWGVTEPPGGSSGKYRLATWNESSLANRCELDNYGVQVNMSFNWAQETYDLTMNMSDSWWASNDPATVSTDNCMYNTDAFTNTYHLPTSTGVSTAVIENLDGESFSSGTQMQYRFDDIRGWGSSETWSSVKQKSVLNNTQSWIEYDFATVPQTETWNIRVENDNSVAAFAPSNYTVDVTSSSGGSPDAPSVDDFEAYNTDYSMEGRVNVEETANIQANVSDPNDNIKNVTMTVVDAEGNTVLDHVKATRVDKFANGEKYEVSYSPADDPDLGGRWNITATVHDKKGDSDTQENYFIYQQFVIGQGALSQGEAEPYEPVFFDKSILVENPSNYDYVDAEARLNILPDMQSIELLDPGGEHPIDEIDRTNDIIRFTADADANYQASWTLNQNVSDIQMQTNNKTEVLGSRTWIKHFNISNNITQVEDIQVETETPPDLGIVTVNLYSEGEEVTSLEDYGLSVSEEENETVSFNVPSLKQGGEQRNLSVRAVIGTPIDKTIQKQTLNAPVTPGTPVQHKWTVSMVNYNRISIDYNTKVRLPLRASSLQVDDNQGVLRFDDFGPYYPVEITIPPFTRKEVVLDFITPAVGISIDRGVPDVAYVGKDLSFRYNITVSNFASTQVDDVQADIDTGVSSVNDLSLRYFTDEITLGEDDGTVVDERSQVTGNYPLNIDRLNGTEIRRYRMDFEASGVTSELLASDQRATGEVEGTSPGLRYRVLEFTSISPLRLEDVRYETNLSCRGSGGVETAVNTQTRKQYGVECSEDDNAVIRLDVFETGENKNVAIYHAPLPSQQSSIDRSTVLLILIFMSTLVSIGLGYWTYRKDKSLPIIGDPKVIRRDE